MNLARLICAIEGEIHHAIANGAPDDCPNLATLYRLRETLRGFWINHD